MGLIDKIFVASVWIPSDVQGTNDTGSVIVSAELEGSGEEISDEYTLQVSVRTGGTATVTVTTISKNNPYSGRVKTLVPFDGTTPVLNVVPGLSIIFDAAAVNLDTATIKVGTYEGSFDAAGVDAGVPTDGVRHQVVNTGTDNVTDSKARLLTQAVLVKKTGLVFSEFLPFADGATEKTSGTRTMPYALSIANTAGSGGSKTADLKVDTVTFGADTIQDLSDGSLHTGVGLKAIDPPYAYAVVSGPLTGMIFALHKDCVNSDVSNVLIFPSRYTQIAPDVSGVEGTYGTDDVDLTESGQLTGVITPSGVAYYWVRQLVPPSAGNESNPYPCNVALDANESTAAGWEI